MITAIRLIIITSVISHRYLLKREWRGKKMMRLGVDFAQGCLCFPAVWGGSCVLRVCIPTDEKWNCQCLIPESKNRTRQHPPSAIIGQAVTELPSDPRKRRQSFNSRNSKCQRICSHTAYRNDLQGLYKVQMSPGSKTQQSGLGFQEQLFHLLNWPCKRASGNLYLNPSDPRPL